MTSAITSPELPHGEPHPALRLAEAVCALIAAIVGPSWLWCFLPGGRALRASMDQLARDFTALMQRIAATPLPPQNPSAPAMPPAHPQATCARRAPSARANPTPSHPHRARPTSPPRHTPSSPCASDEGPGRPGSHRRCMTNLLLKSNYIEIENNK